MKDRSILKPADFEKIKGTIEAHQYRFDEPRQLYIKNIRLIKGVSKMRERAPQYFLAVRVGTLTMVLSKDERLTFNKDEFKPFYEGFDDSELKIKQWNEKLKLNFYKLRIC